MPSMTVSSLASQVEELIINSDDADYTMRQHEPQQSACSTQQSVDDAHELSAPASSNVIDNEIKIVQKTTATTTSEATANVTKNILLSNKAATLDRFARSNNGLSNDGTSSTQRNDPIMRQKRLSTPSATAVVMAAAALAAQQQRQLKQQLHLSRDGRQHLFESATSVPGSVNVATMTTQTSGNNNNSGNINTAASFLNVVGRPKRGSAKLQPSPSSASSHSNTSSLFRDDGFEDDLTSTASERTSGSSSNHRSSYCGSTQSSSGSTTNQSSRNHCQSINNQQHHRLSFQGCRSRQGHRHQMMRRRSGQLEDDIDDEDDQYQSCGEEFVATSSNTSGTTASNFDDCALSTTSSSINISSHDGQILDKLPLADIKQQYRRSLLLEHKHLLEARREHNRATQNRITSLQPPTIVSSFRNDHHYHQTNLSSCPPSPKAQNSTGLASTTNNANRLHSPTGQTTKCDDRTVNIIGHMPTRSPGYWDSNLSITQRVVTEIIETERTYVDDLEQIVTGYICYLRNVLKKQKQSQQIVMRSHRNKNDNSHNDGKSIGQHNEQVSNVMVTDHRRDYQHNLPSNSVGEEEDRSMIMAFDDDTTSALHEVDDYDVEEPDNDFVIKENMSVDCGSSLLMDNDSNRDRSTHSHGPDCHGTVAPTALISSANIKKLFSNLEDIYKFNKDLLFRLEECYLNPSSVAECFVENASGFEIYTHYCTSYPQVVSTLTELMADPDSAQLLKERQNELNQSLPLGAYLLKPVQRILKYHILFQSLIKHTAADESVDEKDGQLINEAFSVMTSIGCHINAMKKRHEHSIRVQEVQGLLRGWEGPDLTTLGELILEDTFKLFERQKSNRHLFLFDNVLLITKKKRDGSLCYKGHIECSNLMLIENIKGQPLVFNTVPFDNPKALCSFQAKNLDKKRDWCLQMKEVIIKSFDVSIPVHVRDILMSLTKNHTTDTPTSKSTSETARAIRAPSYLEKKRTKQDKKK